MSGRAAAALLPATLAFAGCGEKPEPNITKPAAVTGSVSPGPTATTRHTRFAFSGRVAPSSARVALTPEKGTTVQTSADGRFRAQLRQLRRGRPRYVLRGTSPGLRPWTVNLSITRK